MYKCNNCDHHIKKGYEKWSNETQEVLCEFCYDEEIYYNQNPNKEDYDNGKCFSTARAIRNIEELKNK